MAALLPGLTSADGPALRVGDQALDPEALRGAIGALARQLGGHQRVAVWATPSLETVVAVAAALVAGVPAVPVNPDSGARELAHVLGDTAPTLLLGAGAGLPSAERLGGVPTAAVDLAASAELPAEPTDPELPALVVPTSGTTGPPKGAVLPRRAVASNLDALADAWSWTSGDVLTHGLPLFHVHGLVLGVLGPLRLGCGLHHVGRATPAALAAAVEGGATVVFGVPTHYGRLAAEPSSARALSGARLLVSGSAPLPAPVAARIEAATGHQVLERYGLTETLIVSACRVGGPARRGTVGPPLSGVSVRLVDDDGEEVTSYDDAHDDGALGEVLVRGPGVFTGYLGRAEATAAALRDGEFATGDLATRGADGALRILGRRATDLIKSGGYKIGAGEVEAALLAHPAVAEAAVVGEPDDDLGERVVAWVVADGVSGEELTAYVAAQIAPHKRPRRVRFVDALPRTPLGKVRKTELGPPPT